MNATIQYGAIASNPENSNHHQMHFPAYYMLGWMTLKSVYMCRGFRHFCHPLTSLLCIAILRSKIKVMNLSLAFVSVLVAIDRGCSVNFVLATRTKGKSFDRYGIPSRSLNL